MTDFLSAIRTFREEATEEFRRPSQWFLDLLDERVEWLNAQATIRQHRASVRQFRHLPLEEWERAEIALARTTVELPAPAYLAAVTAIHESWADWPPGLLPVRSPSIIWLADPTIQDNFRRAFA